MFYPTAKYVGVNPQHCTGTPVPKEHWYPQHVLSGSGITRPAMDESVRGLGLDAFLQQGFLVPKTGLRTKSPLTIALLGTGVLADKSPITADRNIERDYSNYQGEYKERFRY